MMWVVIPAFEIFAACFSSDIIGTVCIPWGIYSSVAEEKSMGTTVFFVGYLLPLALMIFCS